MPVDPGLKEAVWLLLEITAHQQPGQSIHSDFIVRKFPKISESEIFSALRELVQEGRLTLKASSLDDHGNATAYRIRLKGQEYVPDPPPPVTAAKGDKAANESPSVHVARAAAPTPTPVAAVAGDAPSATATMEADPVADTVTTAVTPAPMVETVVSDDAQELAEQHFADEVSAFFAELSAVRGANEEAKKQLIDQLAVLMAMFQSADAENFTTPIAKLASFKTKVHVIAPDLVSNYILLCQTALRAWLGRV